MPVIVDRRLVVVVATICLLGCSVSDHRLENQIADEVSRGDGTVLRVAELTPFAWTRLHVFEPYTPPGVIRQELGFAWGAAKSTGLESDEGHALLVFVRDKRVVSFVMYPRNQGDFAGLHLVDGYKPENAVFVVRQKQDGWFVLERELADQPSNYGDPRRPALERMWFADAMPCDASSLTPCVQRQA